MHRSEFLKGMLLLGLGLQVAPLSLFANNPSSYSASQLTGKGGLHLIGSPQKLQKEVWHAYEKMRSAAQSDNINIQVVSGYRSFDRQKTIYETKYRNFINEGMTPEEAISEILKYSTLPGTSRHHWGTEMDIIDANQPQPASVLEEEHYYGDGVYSKMKAWLDQHAESFGFYEVYTNKEGRKGFQYEPWHFSYKPISVPMLEEFMCLDIEAILTVENLSGKDILTGQFLHKYYMENILDINPELLP